MFRRKLSQVIEQRIAEERRFIQIVMGPRQTGKTTAVRQALKAADVPFVILDAGAVRGEPLARVRIEWEQARDLARREGGAVFFLDEAQKAAGWSELVKALWDEDSWNEVPLKVVVSGSSSLLLRKGMSESLKGRFEVLRSTQWTFAEMNEAFGFSLDDFLLHGGYPGAAPLADDSDRWLSYLADSIIETTIANDILQLENVRKPALLRRVFEMGAYYSGQEFSYRKILGQLEDRGNTDVIAHYLDLLDGAGMLCGLQKHYGKEFQSRRSSPRFMVYDTALMTAAWRDQAGSLLSDGSLKGRLVESAVGAYLLNRAMAERFELRWWREGNDEVDFVLRRGEQLTAVEVKSGRVKSLDGLASFLTRYPHARPLVVGDVANPLESFLRGEVELFRN
jgi:predicted AAA+ superfamily ATPase